MMRLMISVAALALASCTTSQMTLPVRGWQDVATQDDRERLSDWRTAFNRALDQARAAGHGAEIEREGALLDPDAAVGGPIANGDYACRVIKIGAKSEGLLDYVSYPAFRCRIEGVEQQHFIKLTGSQRHVGLIYPGDQLRQVFLGTMVLGDEIQAYRYGRDRERDLAGWVERIGENRWRILLPYPHFESTIDVIELVPAQ